MSQAPRSQPPPPRPTPDDPYKLQPIQPAPERNVTAEIITISVIAAGVVLLAIAAMLWYRDNIARRPESMPTVAVATLTPGDDGTQNDATAVPAAIISPTIIATQASSQPEIHIPSVSSDQHIPLNTASGTPPGTPLLPSSGSTSVPANEQQITLTPTETAIPGPQIISLPYLSFQEPEPTATPTETLAPTATPPDITAAAPSETPIATFTPAGTPIVTPGPPAAAATPTPASTGIPFVDDDMKAFMAVQADFRLGPSTIFTATDTLGANEEISLRGRDNPGEWVYVCCVDDDDDNQERDNLAWVRQVSVRIQGNELGGVEEGDEGYFDRNQARWLPVVAPRFDLRPLPTVTAPPVNVFPLHRYTPDNRGQLTSLPDLSSAQKLWSVEPETGGSLLSPLVVSGSYVYAGSSDSHIYAWDRVNGSQAARHQLPANVSVAPAYDDGLVYVAAENGYIYALQDPINEQPIWSYQMGSPPLTGINVFSRTLFVGISGQLLAVDGEDGSLVGSLPNSADPLYPTIGGQLLFVYNGNLIAYDIMTLLEEDAENIVWQLPIGSAQVIPVYSSPGIESQAELFVAGTNNHIFNIDANTGVINWDEDNEEAITSFAVNDNTLFIAGDGYIKARTRAAAEDVDSNPVLWRTAIAGRVLDGLLVNNNRIIAFSQSGNVLYLDATNGYVLNTLVTYPAQPTAAGAVSGNYVYVPGQNGKLYGYQQTP